MQQSNNASMATTKPRAKGCRQAAMSQDLLLIPNSDCPGRDRVAKDATSAATTETTATPMTSASKTSRTLGEFLKGYHSKLPYKPSLLFLIYMRMRKGLLRLRA